MSSYSRFNMTNIYKFLLPSQPGKRRAEQRQRRCKSTNMFLSEAPPMSKTSICLLHPTLASGASSDRNRAEAHSGHPGHQRAGEMSEPVRQ